MKKPKNYYCHRGTIEQGGIIGGRKLEIVEKIGEGSFGQVYKVFDPQSSELSVLKRFKKSDHLLKEQARILGQLTNSQGFDSLKLTSRVGIDSIFFEGKNEQQNKKQGQNAILMGCLGPSTTSIMRRIKKMNIYSMKKIAYQLIKKLKQMHSKLYVHRDIKPDNILFGNKYDSHSVYLIDFGLTTPFKKSSTKPRRILQSLVGTARYCPLVSHRGLEQFPKDDLQSLGYVLLYFMTGSLPWDKQQSQNDQILFQKIHKKKSQCSLETLCAGVNSLRKYWTKIKPLNVGQKINYDQILEFFDVGDHNLQNCYQFCNDCWIKNGSNGYRIKKQKNKLKETKQNDEGEIIYQPRSNAIRTSIIS